MSTYLLDANIFIQAKNLHYGFDFCPAFWDWLLAENAIGKVHSIDKVADELAAGVDDLSTWAAENEGLFLPTTASVLPHFTTVFEWITSQNYDASQINIFSQAADFYLIAHALASGYILVTHETSAPLAKKIKIPNVCIGLGVNFMSPYQMLRREQARFVLGSS